MALSPAAQAKIDALKNRKTGATASSTKLQAAKTLQPKATHINQADVPQPTPQIVSQPYSQTSQKNVPQVPVTTGNVQTDSKLEALRNRGDGTIDNVKTNALVNQGLLPESQRENVSQTQQIDTPGGTQIEVPKYQAPEAEKGTDLSGIDTSAWTPEMKQSTIVEAEQALAGQSFPSNYWKSLAVGDYLRKKRNAQLGLPENVEILTLMNEKGEQKTFTYPMEDVTEANFAQRRDREAVKAASRKAASEGFGFSNTKERTGQGQLSNGVHYRYKEEAENKKKGGDGVTQFRDHEFTSGSLEVWDGSSWISVKESSDKPLGTSNIRKQLQKMGIYEELGAKAAPPPPEETPGVKDQLTQAATKTQEEIAAMPLQERLEYMRNRGSEQRVGATETPPISEEMKSKIEAARAASNNPKSANWSIQGLLNDFAKQNPHMQPDELVNTIKDQVGYRPIDDEVYDLFYSYYQPRAGESPGATGETTTTTESWDVPGMGGETTTTTTPGAGGTGGAGGEGETGEVLPPGQFQGLGGQLTPTEEQAGVTIEMKQMASQQRVAYNKLLAHLNDDTGETRSERYHRLRQERGIQEHEDDKSEAFTNIQRLQTQIKDIQKSVDARGTDKGLTAAQVARMEGLETKGQAEMLEAQQNVLASANLEIEMINDVIDRDMAFDDKDRADKLERLKLLAANTDMTPMEKEVLGMTIKYQVEEDTKLNDSMDAMQSVILASGIAPVKFQETREQMKKMLDEGYSVEQAVAGGWSAIQSNAQVSRYISGGLGSSAGGIGAGGGGAGTRSSGDTSYQAPSAPETPGYADKEANIKELVDLGHSRSRIERQLKAIDPEIINDPNVIAILDKFFPSNLTYTTIEEINTARDNGDISPQTASDEKIKLASYNEEVGAERLEEKKRVDKGISEEVDHLAARVIKIDQRMEELNKKDKKTPEEVKEMMDLRKEKKKVVGQIGFSDRIKLGF